MILQLCISCREDAHSAFQELKRLQSPILKQPYPMLPFVVEVDASELVVGAVHLQCHGLHSK